MEVRLSTDEFALALAFEGHLANAKALLGITYLSLDESGYVARMTAAAASLAARRFLKPAGTQSTLAPELQAMIQSLSQAPYTIRYQVGTDHGIRTIGFHAVEGGYVRHEMESGVVHDFAPVLGEQLIEEGLWDFGIEESTTVSPFRLSSATLEEVKAALPTDQASAYRFLLENSIDPNTAERFVRDLAMVEWYGTVAKITYDEQRIPLINEGALLFRGHQQTWLLQFAEQRADADLVIETANVTNFSNVIASILR